MKKLKNIYNFLFIFCLTWFLVGCQNRVNIKESSLVKVEVIVTFNGPVDLAKYDYYLIIKQMSDLLADSTPIRLPIGTLYPYFPSPGRDYNINNPAITQYHSSEGVQDGINYYYRQYFQYWSDYIVINQLTKRLYKSGVFSFDLDTSNNDVYDKHYPSELSYRLATSGLSEKNHDQLVISFNSHDLSKTTPYLYFAVATSSMKDGVGTGYLMDTMVDSDAYLRIDSEYQIMNQLFSGEDNSLESSLDIIALEARTF